MVFAGAAYTLAGFLSLYGFIFFYLATKSTGNYGTLKMKNIFFIFGFLYVAIAHFSVLSAVAYSIDMTHLSPCENVVANSTSLSSTVVSYEYEDSCEDRTPPTSTERLFKVLSYLIYIDAIAILIGGLFFIRELFRKW